MLHKQTNKEMPEKRRIVFSALVAIATLAFFFVFFPNIEIATTQPKQNEPLAILVEKRSGQDVGFDEIFDYSPLFITTRWNATKTPKDIPPPSGWNFDKTEDEEYAKDLRSPSFLIDANTYMKRGKSSMARAIMRNAFIGYARKDSEISTISTQDKVTFSLIDLQSGKEIKTLSFESSLSKNMFSIAEFKVSIENDGWTMTPLVSQSSGNEKTDEELSKMLKPRDLLKGVPSGNYKAIFVP